MTVFLNNVKLKFKDWIVAQSNKKSAVWWLSLVAFTESSFFLIPPDTLLIPLATVRRNEWLRLALITSIMSVFGGILGYAIGFFFFDVWGQRLVNAYGLEHNLAVVKTMFENNAFLAIFTSAFTPIPYKIFTIGAGLFSINMLTFIVGSFIGRSMRFFIVAYIFKQWGPIFGRVILKYFTLATIIFIIIVSSYIVYKIVG